ncbi:MAG: hypothetical protein HKP58_05700 [Desulfatitalea sp.]|nr:hypothetical protein [Desulfatitalea sp.]NNJ99889.1 hypothetical protein [Desulfatitalea sp.]
MKNPTKRAILHIVIATGVASVVTQLVLMREFLAQFQGNEPIVALVLFTWLVAGGIGTRLARRVLSAHAGQLARLSFLLAMLAPAQIMAVRLLRPMLFGAGTSVGFYATFLFTAATMAPYALLVGYLLPYSLYVIRRIETGYTGVGIYLADNIGDVCGGALFTFVLVVWADPMPSLLVAHLPLAMAAGRLAANRWEQLAGPLEVLCVLLGAVWFEPLSLAPTGGRLVHYEETPHGRLTVHQSSEQTTLFANGRPMAASHDPMTAERLVHYALCQVSTPRRVLLIASRGGMLAQLQKYHPAAVDYVELDPAMIRLMYTYDLEHPFEGVHAVEADARIWLMQHTAAYDAVLISLPEPETFQLNRFYTDPFFALVAQRLTHGGILCFSVEGAANYLTRAQRQIISSLWKTARRHFAHVRLLPGEPIFFLCRQEPVDLDIPGRLARAGVDTLYAGPYFSGEVTRERIDRLEAALDRNAPVNGDMHPYLMQLAMVQWFTKFGNSPGWFMSLAAAALLFFLARLGRAEFVLFTTGMTAMGIQMVLIFAFQIYLGYIYAKIGMLVTVCLAGLPAGAWWGRRVKKAHVLLLATDGMLIILIIGLTAALHLVGDGLPGIFYYVSGFMLSAACGFQIPLALSFMGDAPEAAARIFSVDLVGAAAGALLCGALLIPYLGISGATLVLAGGKLVGMLRLAGRYAPF